MATIIYYIRQVNAGKFSVFTCVCLCVCAQMADPYKEDNAFKAMGFELDLHVLRDSPDSPKMGMARVTSPLKFIWRICALPELLVAYKIT